MNCSRHWLHALIAALSLVGAGCGTKTASAPEPGSAAPPPPPQPVARPAPGPAAPVPQLRQPSRIQRARKTDAPDEPTSNHFVIVEPPGMLITSPREASLRDQFVVFRPSTRAQPNEFELVLPQPSHSHRPPGAGLPGEPPRTVRLPEGFVPATNDSPAPEGFPRRIRCERDGSEMVYVPPGVFIQGTDTGPADCAPAHPVYVSGFYIDVTEVTLGQFETFQKRQKELKRGILPAPLNAGDPSTHPVTGISWRDAELYARQVGKELPTEAEWERAARSLSSFPYPWGTGRPAWNSPRMLGQITAVMSYSADVSADGVYDMAGNAREWCADWYASDTYRDAREKDGSPIRDPKGPSRAEFVGHRVIKGGRTGWELWHRDHAPLREPVAGVGFRGVLRLPASAAASMRDQPLVPPATSPPTPRPAGSGF